MITMHAWFDPLTDILFRPFIKTAAQGAATAIYLAQSPEVDGKSGGCYANCKEKKLPERILHHPLQDVYKRQPYKLEAYGLTIEGISNIIAQENRNTPGGSIDIGSNTYTLRVPVSYTHLI